MAGDCLLPAQRLWFSIRLGTTDRASNSCLTKTDRELSAGKCFTWDFYHQNNKYPCGLQIKIPVGLSSAFNSVFDLFSKKREKKREHNKWTQLPAILKRTKQFYEINSGAGFIIWMFEDEPLWLYMYMPTVSKIYHFCYQVTEHHYSWKRQETQLFPTRHDKVTERTKLVQ